MEFTTKTNVVLQDRHLEFLTFPIPVIFYKKINTLCTLRLKINLAI